MANDGNVEGEGGVEQADNARVVLLPIDDGSQLGRSGASAARIPNHLNQLLRSSRLNVIPEDG